MSRGCTVVISVSEVELLALPHSSCLPSPPCSRGQVGMKSSLLPRPGYPLEILFVQPLDSPAEKLVLCSQPVSSSGQGASVPACQSLARDLGSSHPWVQMAKYSA